MAAKTSNPIVLVIDRNHQNIGLNWIQWFACGDRRKCDIQDGHKQLGPGHTDTEENALQEDGSSKKKLDRQIVILAIPGKK